MEKKKAGGCTWWGWILVVIVLAAIGFGIWAFFHYKNKSSSGVMKPSENFGEALQIAMQFFDVQKSGKLEKNPIPWRGDSALKDGSDAKIDLSKGMYDAGDHMKFSFPMAFTASVFSWAILEYGDLLKSTNYLHPAQHSLRWITDFLVNAHPDDDTLYIQVGDAEVDHGCWNRPEDMDEKRPLTQVNASAPGTDVAAETAAALAAASLVFKSSDSTYSTYLLKHAKQLFTFADKNRELYSVSVPEIAKYYNSTGYGDELLWAAGWLYHATGDKSYFDYATGKNGEEYGNWGKPTWFSWDNKLAGAQVLLSRVSFLGSKDVASSEVLQKYKQSAEAVMCGLIPSSPSATSSKTESGLIWVSEWNSLQQPVLAGFLAVLYSDYMQTSKNTKLTCDGKDFSPTDLRNFAITQADYVLGKNPMKMSYLVGYGRKYPEQVHHRGASIPADQKPGCKDGYKWFESNKPNPNVAMGALVGGPFLNESYVDKRNNPTQGEPSTYNSAAIVGLLSGLLSSSSVKNSFT